MKVVKWVLWIVVALIIVVVGAIAFIAMTVDPNEYKPDLIKMVKDHTGRTLTISGDIELKFYPKIGAAVQGVTLSAPNSDQRFAQVDEARVALALLPLLSKQFIVDEVTLTGLEADLVKYKDGSTNFDDLLGEKAEEPTKPKEAKPSKSAKMPAIDIEPTSRIRPTARSCALPTSISIPVASPAACRGKWIFPRVSTAPSPSSRCRSICRRAIASISRRAAVSCPTWISRPTAMPQHSMRCNSASRATPRVSIRKPDASI